MSLSLKRGKRKEERGNLGTNPLVVLGRGWSFGVGEGNPSVCGRDRALSQRSSATRGQEGCFA
jgi:hypothetical protein